MTPKAEAVYISGMEQGMTPIEARMCAETVECECGCEWGVHSSWCPMSAYVIRQTDWDDNEIE